MFEINQKCPTKWKANAILTEMSVTRLSLLDYLSVRTYYNSAKHKIHPKGCILSFSFCLSFGKQTNFGFVIISGILLLLFYFGQNLSLGKTFY